MHHCKRHSDNQSITALLIVSARYFGLSRRQSSDAERAALNYCDCDVYSQEHDEQTAHP